MNRCVAWACLSVVWGCGFGVGGRGEPLPPSRVAEPQDVADLAGFSGPKLAVVGDFGVNSDDEARVAALVASWNPDVVLTLGDNNYPVGMSVTLDQNVGKYYARYIGGYMGSYGPGAAVNRFFPTPGNHDWYGPEKLNPYVRYFNLPGNERYYEQRLGPLHLFSLDSDEHEPDGNTVDSVQARWLEPRLKASTACLKLVYFHHPPYSSGTHGNATHMQWPFAAWGATTVMAGHDHIYERLVVDGIPYFVNGLGGAPTYPVGAAQPQTRTRYNADHGAMLVRIHRDGVEYQFRDTTNRLVDRTFTPMDCPDAVGPLVVPGPKSAQP